MFQQTFKNFNVHFNALNESNSFSSGDVVAGQISFDLTQQTKIDRITMTLEGKASVVWTTGGGGGGKRRRSHRRTHSAKVEYFKLQSVVSQQDAAVGGTAKLQPGTHVYRFTCQIPHGDFPPSYTGTNGKIVYSLTVGIYRPWHLSKDFVTELKFHSRINTNQPDLWAPLSGSNLMTLCCLWCASGPVKLTASAEKKAFSPGETAKITCDFGNASSRTATPKVKLQQKQSFYTHNKASQRVVVKNLASQTGQPIGGHTSVVRSEFLLTIPSTAEHTISNCTILRVDYVIEVVLSVTGAHDLKVIIPIILCDTPVNVLSS